MGHLLALQAVFYGLLIGLIAVETFQSFARVDRTVGEVGRRGHLPPWSDGIFGAR
jgi:hypothetical protein